MVTHLASAVDASRVDLVAMSPLAPSLQGAALSALVDELRKRRCRGADRAGVWSHTRWMAHGPCRQACPRADAKVARAL